jgi:peptidoglycan/xylan/chitin deacetylase (PgdA/CDA1 family)
MHTWPHATVLTYHEVLADKVRSRYSVSCDQFDSHLCLIQREQGPKARRPVVTFDDGHLSNYEHALPLLQARGIKAIFFITAGLVGKRPDSMDWPQIRDLVKAGHSVQAHGWSHRFLSGCSEAELTHELLHARNLLEDKLGCEINELSLPGGRFDQRTLRFAAMSSYRRVYCSQPWRHIRISASCELVGRVMVRRGMRPGRVLALVEQTSIARGIVYAEHWARHGAWILVGEAQYHALWSSLARRGGGYRAKSTPFKDDAICSQCMLSRSDRRTGYENASL